MKPMQICLFPFTAMHLVLQKPMARALLYWDSTEARQFRIAQKENSVIFLEEDYQTTYDGFDPNNPESVISLVLMQGLT